MGRLLVQGGYPLSGEISVSGSKNATLPILAATLLTEEVSVLSNVPNLKDVTAMLELLIEFGLRMKVHGHQTISLESLGNLHTLAPYELMVKTRASILVLGPLLAKYKRATVFFPGGCEIGTRPIDLHLSGLEKMGARIRMDNNCIRADCPNGLRGTVLDLKIPSVTTTENLMMAATLAQGITVIQNAAREPEVVELASFLNKMGANIKGVGTEQVVIKGVEALKGVNHTIIPDRLEAATFLIAAACTRGSMTVRGISPTLIEPVLDKLKEFGVAVTKERNQISISAINKPIHAVNVETAPYPGFPTDLQAQIMVLNTIAKGTSIITENIFENRFLHVPELKRMGANITIKGRQAICQGVNQLKGMEVSASDLRASASLVLAGLMAAGNTVIHSVDYLDRGYEFFEEKLLKLGAHLQPLD